MTGGGGGLCVMYAAIAMPGTKKGLTQRFPTLFASRPQYGFQHFSRPQLDPEWMFATTRDPKISLKDDYYTRKILVLAIDVSVEGCSISETQFFPPRLSPIRT